MEADKQEKTIYHTPIKIETICRNGSERYGAKALCKFWEEGATLRIEVSQYGETKTIAMQKLMRFLANGGKNNLLLVSDEK